MLRFFENNNAVSPVVATALLLVVAVISVVGFQGWFTAFSSSVLVDVEGQTSSSGVASVEGIFNDNLYLKSSGNSKIDLLKVTDGLGNEVCSFSSSVSNDSISNLVGHWKFDNTDDGIIKDFSGNGHDGKLFGNSRMILNFDNNDANDLTAYENDGIVNGASWVDTRCISNGCYSFDGVDDFIEINNSASFDLVKDFSLSFWFNPNSFGENNYSRILNYRNTNVGQTQFIVNVHEPKNSIQITVSNSTSDYHVFNLEKNITLNSWNYGTIVFGNNKTNMYLNGELASSINFSDDLYNSSGNLIIGASEEHMEHRAFDGLIDEVGIYSKVLSSSEILDLYNFRKAKFIDFNSDGLEFDGVDDFVDLGNKSWGNFNDVSVNIIFKRYTDLNVPLFSNEAGGNSLFLIRAGNFHNWQTGRMNFYWGDGTPLFLSNKTSDVNEFTNYFVTANLTSMETKSYFYGKYDRNFSYPQMNTFGVTSFNFGRYGTNFFEGIISEVRIYDKVLTSDEIKFLAVDLGLSNDDLNKIDLSSCNLDKGEKYNILTGGKNGLSEVSIIVK